MRKLLLTGFEPFDGMESNLSTDIVKEFTNIQSLILPVTFNEAFKQLKPVVEDIKPDVLLLFGLADIRDKVTIERIAINTLHARITDNEGHQPQHELIQKTGTDGIFSNLPMKELEKLDEHIEISNTAGTYVCNFLMYQSLFHFKQDMQVGFIHVPATEKMNKQKYLNYEKTLSAVKKIISFLQEQP